MKQSEFGTTSVGRENDKRFKLTSREIELIQHWRFIGSSVKSIASSFGISISTVYYYTDANYRQKVKARNAKRRRTPEEEAAYGTPAKQRRRCLVRNKVREYTRNQIKEWRQKNIEKYRLHAKLYARNWRANRKIKVENT